MSGGDALAARESIDSVAIRTSQETFPPGDLEASGSNSGGPSAAGERYWYWSDPEEPGASALTAEQRKNARYGCTVLPGAGAERELQLYEGRGDKATLKVAKTKGKTAKPGSLVPMKYLNKYGFETNRSALLPTLEQCEKAKDGAWGGLSSVEAASRLEIFGPNALPEKPRTPCIDLLMQFWGPMPVRFATGGFLRVFLLLLCAPSLRCVVF